MKRFVILFVMMFFVTSECFAASGDKVYYEDFSSYKEGELPAGWIGGDNLAVKETNRKKILAPFVIGAYDVTTKNIKFPNNFITTVILKFYSPRYSERLSINIGSYTIIMFENKVSTIVKDKETNSEKIDTSAGKTFSISVKKEGVIYTLSVNNQKIFTGRYAGLEMSNIRFKSLSKFEIESITVEEL